MHLVDESLKVGGSGSDNSMQWTFFMNPLPMTIWTKVLFQSSNSSFFWPNFFLLVLAQVSSCAWESCGGSGWWTSGLTPQRAGGEGVAYNWRGIEASLVECKSCLLVLFLIYWALDFVSLIHCKNVAISRWCNRWIIWLGIHGPNLPLNFSSNAPLGGCAGIPDVGCGLRHQWEGVLRVVVWFVNFAMRLLFLTSWVAAQTWAELGHLTNYMAKQITKQKCTSN